MRDCSRRHFLGLTAGLTASVVFAQEPAGPVEDVAAVRGARTQAIAEAFRLGNASHAFDHLGAFGFQAETAAKCGATVIYASGVGGDGYGGLPDPDEWQRRLDNARAYTEKAKGLGIPVVLGYLCATSIVGLDGFDQHWSPEFRAKFKTEPREWLQRNENGEPLPSWYGGEYRPACMNHPDWRTYEKEMLNYQLGTGHDGIFFDNPTVHPQGCYCDHCMTAFGRFLEEEGKGDVPQVPSELRACATERKRDFKRFRVTIAKAFLAEMRIFAQTVNPNALITANNSTNSPGVIYSQCSLYGYSPFEMSRTEDFIVIEDMGSQPRSTDDGKVIEYGPTYKQLKALCHDKPLVVCTIADADYHTPPDLMRLALAEAAANGATYMVWPTWPEEHRARLSAAVRTQVDFLRKYAYTYEQTTPRRECSLFLPMRRWLDSDVCGASDLAAELTRANVQYAVFSEEDFHQNLHELNVIVESQHVLNDIERVSEKSSNRPTWQADVQPNWLQLMARTYPPRAVHLNDAPRVRAYVHDADDATFVHLLNLDIRKRDSFHDEIFPAKDVDLRVRMELCNRPSEIKGRSASVVSAELFTADTGTTRGPIEFKVDEDSEYIRVKIPILEVASILVFTIG